MARPITLFTGQWADLPFDEVCRLASQWGYDGLEIACWGDHFEVDRALAEADYVDRKREQLAKYHLKVFAISNHLVGQAVCDRIDERHQAILSPEIWGDGEPEGVRRRAATEMGRTAEAARAFGVDVVNGFTGSSIWHSIYAFPPTSQDYWDAGFRDFAERWTPIMDTFATHGVRFGLEVHPTEIAFDIASSERALEAIGQHPQFGFNFDPSHLAYQGVDYVAFLRRFADRIVNAHMKDVWWGHGDGSVGIFGGHTSFGDARRAWDFRSVGRGDVNFEEIIVALNDIEYSGPLSVEWEDSRMDRVHGATESAAFLKRLDFAPSAVAFDAAFDKDEQ
jgi:sugar phosphate isomerase/epimerase